MYGIISFIHRIFHYVLIVSKIVKELCFVNVLILWRQLTFSFKRSLRRFRTLNILLLFLNEILKITYKEYVYILAILMDLFMSDDGLALVDRHDFVPTN